MEYEINFTPACDAWIAKCQKKDSPTCKRILAYIFRMQTGNFGDHKSVGDDVSELRIDLGPGYRVYYTVRDLKVVIVLCGGDKKSQASDIAAAKELARTL